MGWPWLQEIFLHKNTKEKKEHVPFCLLLLAELAILEEIFLMFREWFFSNFVRNDRKYVWNDKI